MRGHHDVNTIPEQADAFVSLSHKLKNSVAIEILLLHSQPFTNSHLQLFIIAEPAPTQVLSSSVRYLHPYT
jgi:hypothetical protein